MAFFPRGLSCISDAQSALHRLTPLFHADLFKKHGITIEDQDEALVVKDATFEWELPAKEVTPKEKGNEAPVHSGVPFQVSGVNLVVPRSQLLAITGVVGSGKVSIVHSS
jgi:ATP-binding cassette, subfamily C (CFTR/MRP), member 1